MIEQGSPEWFAQRLGKVTASRVADVIAKTKTGYSTSRANYMTELALERITGARQEGFTNAAMQWGTETEPLARAAYEAETGEIVDEVPMIEHPSILMTGASPDGLIGSDGLIEIKCPNSATHMETLISGKPAGKYITQMMWQMACTKRQWCDFVSFDPRFPQHLQLYVTRVLRDDVMVKSLENEVAQFLDELGAMVTTLSNYKKAA
jgi:putative phage-type endonuclease